MARTNYSYEKRQKELARQKKQEEKRLRKLEKRADTAEDAEEVTVSDGMLESAGDDLPDQAL